MVPPELQDQLVQLVREVRPDLQDQEDSRGRQVKLESHEIQEKMVKLDYLYVTTWSLWNDIRLLTQTVPVVFRGARAHH